MSRWIAPTFVLALIVTPLVAVDPPQKPSRSTIGDAAALVVSAEEGKITVKYTVLVPSGNSGARRGRSRRPNVKAQEKEETLELASDVTIKDTKAKDGAGALSSLAEGTPIKLHLVKETTHIPNEKPMSRVVVSKIEILHPKMKK